MISQLFVFTLKYLNEEKNNRHDTDHFAYKKSNRCYKITIGIQSVRDNVVLPKSL